MNQIGDTVEMLRGLSESGDADQFMSWCKKVGPDGLADLIEYTERDDDVEIVSMLGEGVPKSLGVCISSEGKYARYVLDDGSIECLEGEF